MPSFSKTTLDQVDEKILDVLASNARISMRDIAIEIGMSAPSTADRVKRLTDIGVIKSFTVDIDFSKLGYAFEAVVLVSPFEGKLAETENFLRAQGNCIECDKVTGEECYIARFVFSSIEEMDRLINHVSGSASTKTSIVKSKPIPRKKLV